MQLAHAVFARTDRIGFGTAIMNIVGGNGGPVAAADRVRSLAWLNALSPQPRELAIGVAAGRFPYINQPFGIVPRSTVERILWPQYQQLIFAEALEIFLRLSQGEVLSSADLPPRRITRAGFRTEEAFVQAQQALRAEGITLDAADGLAYTPRWSFEALQLVPAMTPTELAAHLRFVLGSSDAVARETALRLADMDIFNLSFTPPAAIDKIHAEMATRCASAGRTWHRSRMPRTVLVFLAATTELAREQASRCFDTYIEAMRGTAVVPAKDMLMERALIGDAAEIRRQLAPEDPHGFHSDDRLMLWFEFNQTDNDVIIDQMRRFAEEVAPSYTT